LVIFRKSRRPRESTSRLSVLYGNSESEGTTGERRRFMKAKCGGLRCAELRGDILSYLLFCKRYVMVMFGLRDASDGGRDGIPEVQKSSKKL
jgi:hypothetical protein